MNRPVHPATPGPGGGGTSGPGRCHTADLRASFGRPDAATGHLGVVLVLTTQSSRTCRVYGHGGIQLLGAAGAALPTQQVRSPPPPRLVRLVPGGERPLRTLLVRHCGGRGCEQAAFLCGGR